MSDEYDKYLHLFCQRFEDGMEEAGLVKTNKCGFIFIFVRDNKPGCIDRASNLDDESIKNVLSDILSEMERKP